MHLIRNRAVRKRALPLLATGLALLLACSESDEYGEALLIGPAAESLGGVYQFNAPIDNGLTTECGSATVASGTSSDSSSAESSSSSSSTSSDSSSTETQFDINSYIQFEDGQVLFMKYTYDSEEESFRMTPTTSNVSTCPTTDFINCNGTDGVNPTCDTVDNVTCGGSSTFIFTSTAPELSFQATSGSVSWEDGFSLNTDKNGVAMTELEFEMVDDTGSIFTGTLFCVTD
ncbi:MAG: hypothetical protein KDK30_13010 [Leptospiraceae bacterium]|nr:hypothetical protein [Leptospiraceae bacterium]